MISDYFNHQARYYRVTESATGMGNSTRTWTAQGSPPLGFNCRPDETWPGNFRDLGAGEQQTGRRRWFLESSFVGIEEGDVISVTSGPDAPINLMVEKVARDPNLSLAVHHVEVDVTKLEGALS